MRKHVFSRKIRALSERILDKFFPNYLGEEYLCPLCETGLSHFTPLPPYYFRELDKNQHVYSVFQSETMNLENYSCPRCGASDRDRLYALYFRERLDQNRSYEMLDLAPAASLQKLIKRFANVEYRSADLLMEGVDDNVDITDMNIYPDGMFDIFICSHVLEHIPDDRRAMAELYRILSPQGWGIAMVPINLGLEATHEDPSVTDEGMRWKYFGQDDHVRMYSKNGFIKQLESVGFIVDQYGIEHFGEATFHLNGIHPRSILYVVHK